MSTINCYTLSAKAGVLLIGAEVDVGLCVTDGWAYPSATVGFTIGGVLASLGAGKETTEVSETDIATVFNESYFKLIAHDEVVLGVSNNQYRGISDYEHGGDGSYSPPSAIAEAKAKGMLVWDRHGQYEGKGNIEDDRYEVGLFGVVPSGNKFDHMATNPPGMIKFDIGAFVVNGAAYLAKSVGEWYWSDAWGL